MSSLYEHAKETYAKIGIDTEEVLKKLAELPISLHCWQGDDVVGFENTGSLSGGIMATGNYPGKAGTPQELMADIEEVLSLLPGKYKINLHAIYAITDGTVDRDKL